MQTQKIYKRDNNGNIRVWWAETDNEANWRTHSGVLDGTITTSEWSYAPAKSQNNSKDQAIFEAQAAMKKRLKLDYRINIQDIDKQRNSIIKPMLAHSYPGWVGGLKCYAQPKLDGMRCLATPSGLWSRNNRPIINAPHIEKQLSNFFEFYPNIILDGELYNHELHNNFNMIMSMAKKTKPSVADLHASAKHLQYHIYDIFDVEKPNRKYSDRFEQLYAIPREPSLHVVETKLISSEEDLDLHFAELLRAGYEGQMIRYDRPYEQKRTSYLLKRKEIVDEEFELLNIEEGDGNWAGFGKIAVCRAKNGKTFGAGISGTQEFCNQLLKNKDNYTMVTVKYQALTPDGVPRFPIAIKFWEEEFAELEGRNEPMKDLFK